MIKDEELKFEVVEDEDRIIILLNNLPVRVIRLRSVKPLHIWSIFILTLIH
jgi:hypothetical protein